MTPRLIGGDVTIDLDIDRWSEAACPTEHRLLARVSGPALDIGCGPGRIAHALATRGVTTLGIDPAVEAVALARSRGIQVLCRSVFDPLPGHGRWTSALLLDGNVGIGGDPIRLLQRVRSLIRVGGRVYIETAPPGTATRTFSARIHRGDEISPAFPWAVVGAGDIRVIASRASLQVIDSWEDGSRWFAEASPR